MSETRRSQSALRSAKFVYRRLRGGGVSWCQISMLYVLVVALLCLHAAAAEASLRAPTPLSPYGAQLSRAELSLQNNASLYLSEIAYCGAWAERAYVGPYTSTFVYNATIEDTDAGLAGFVGTHGALQAIVITFRGSDNAANWVTDLDALTTEYSSCDGCKVHKGFYKAFQKIEADLREVIKMLLEDHPTYTLLLTGHSYGAAVSTLAAADAAHILQLSGVNLVTFGSPRLGNDKFAEWFSYHLSPSVAVQRNTHFKDMVVHCPMHERFTHISGEVYEDDIETFKVCNGLEDPTCSYQWSVTSVKDHLVYQGLPMGDDGCSITSSPEPRS